MIAGLTGGELNADDYKSLAGRWIDADTADGACLRRVISIDGAELVGKAGEPGNYAGIAIPYVWPGDSAVRSVRVRRDQPDLESNHAGKLVQKRKYLGAPGRGNLLYTPPRLALEHLGDTGIPLIVVEGEFKTLALWRLAWHGLGDDAMEPAFVPIGLQGVNSWRGKTGRVPGEGPGEWKETKGPIADLSRISWSGRRVIIMFDRNVEEQGSQVAEARWHLKAELEARGAEISFFRWPADVPQEVNGIDDYLAVRGPEETVRQLRRVKRVTRRRQVVSVSDAVDGAEWQKALIRNAQGAPKPLVANALTFLRNLPELQNMLSYDSFAQRVMALGGTPWSGQSREWVDADDVSLTEFLQRKGLLVNKATVADAVGLVAAEQSYHPVREYLDRLEWDRESRIDQWLVDYAGAKDTALVRAISARWLISAIARVMIPGCQADHCLIVEGSQGIGKSSALRVLGGEWFSDDLGAVLAGKSAAEAVQGVWIAEFAELAQVVGLKAEMEVVKAFMTRRVDRYRAPYGRRVEAYPRQCVFAGSVNLTQYLKDETGARRWWCVSCGRFDVPRLEKVRDQLWAEALTRFRAGELYHLVEHDLMVDVQREQDRRYEDDPWDTRVWKWVETKQEEWDGKGGLASEFAIRLEDVLSGSLEKPIERWQMADKRRVGNILRRHGMVNHQRRAYDDDDRPILRQDRDKVREVREYVWIFPA